MFFRNVTFFQFPASLDLSQLEVLLPEATLKPVGPLEMAARGFIAPTGNDDDGLAQRQGDTVWLTVGSQDRMLPGSVVNDHLARKIAEVEEREGRKIGGRARKRLRDDLLHELLPRAFVRQRRTDALLFLDLGVLAVDTANRKTAEGVASEIRRARGSSFPALPLNAEVAPRSVLTAWLAGEPLPEGLSLGWDCELRDPMDGGACVKCTDQQPQSEEIVTHLEAGKQCTRLSLVLGDRLAFTADENLVVRKLRFLEAAVESLESIERDDLKAELLARFALNAGELRVLFQLVRDAFKLREVAP